MVKSNLFKSRTVVSSSLSRDKCPYESKAESRACPYLNTFAAIASLSVELGNLHGGRSRSIGGRPTKPYVAIKAGPRPVLRAVHISVPDGFELDVVVVCVPVLYFANPAFPKSGESDGAVVMLHTILTQREFPATHSQARLPELSVDVGPSNRSTPSARNGQA